VPAQFGRLLQAYWKRIIRCAHGYGFPKGTIMEPADLPEPRSCPPHYWLITDGPHAVQLWICQRCGAEQQRAVPVKQSFRWVVPGAHRKNVEPTQSGPSIPMDSGWP